MAEENTTTLDPLVPRLMEALFVSGMSRTRFGYVYFGDPAFITKAMRGRRFRTATAEKIESVLKEIGV